MPEESRSASDVKRVVTFTSSAGRGCEHCTGVRWREDQVETAVNHYIDKHGYQLLHVGQQTSHDAEGNPWQSTVAVVGSSAPPPVLEHKVVIQTYTVAKD